MNFQDLLANYHRLEPYPTLDKFYLKRGVRNYPEVHVGVNLLAKHCAQEERTLLDASYSAGAFTRLRKPTAETLVLENSHAHLTCAKQNLKSFKATLSANSIWDVPQNSFHQVVNIPPTDKGSARVIAEMNAAQKVLTDDGTAYFVMHKDQGAKRYEKHLKQLFNKTDVIAKHQGWRLVKANKKNEICADYAMHAFDIQSLNLNADVGVYAAGKLDPGTAFLLETIDIDWAAKRVLDIGCGYGLLALKASFAGANVTAVDDDLLAVQSCYKNAQNYALDIRCLHSDINSALKQDEQVEIVITNPPFHIGKFVTLELPFAFIAAAHKHLVNGGELLLVANKALAYEPLLAKFSFWESLAENKQFKVLRAIK